MKLLTCRLWCCSVALELSMSRIIVLPKFIMLIGYRVRSCEPRPRSVCLNYCQRCDMTLIWIDSFGPQGTLVDGYRDTGIQGYRGIGVQGCRGAGMQGYTGALCSCYGMKHSFPFSLLFTYTCYTIAICKRCHHIDELSLIPL